MLSSALSKEVYSDFGHREMASISFIFPLSLFLLTIGGVHKLRWQEEVGTRYRLKFFSNFRILNLAVKIAQFWLSKSIFYHPNPSKFFFSLKNIESGAQLLLMTHFAYCHFWSTLFTKIGPKLQTLIPNQALICQRPFLVRKCLFPFN